MQECEVCHITLSNEDVLKYNSICPCCHSKNSFFEKYIMDIKRISTDESFIIEMTELYKNDPIEYQLKIQQFKTQIQQQKQTQSIQQKSSIPHCPTCNSTNIQKISGLSKAGSVAIWGLLSRKVHKQWHCNNCGSEW